MTEIIPEMCREFWVWRIVTVGFMSTKHGGAGDKGQKNRVSCGTVQ